jgi:hypothetical protein
MVSPIDPRNYREPQQDPERNPPPPPQQPPSNVMPADKIDANYKALMELRGRVKRALEVAWHAGQIEGDHHKAWVIDQMVHHLLDSGYDAYIAEYNQEGYVWNKGTPP